ncbi:hypothetical protein BFINE_20910 [Bacteroides finegoldii DSM 17565]|nr:hypothetical protein BFINE_20910 [Bacteroides finegoldii DSM 17565]
MYVDLNGDRKIDENDMGYDYGFTDDPEYMVGMNLGFSWKNLEVNTQWTGAWNVSRMISDVFRRPFLSSSGNVAGGLLAYHLTNTWTKENPSQDAKYPRATWRTLITTMRNQLFTNRIPNICVSRPLLLLIIFSSL